MFSEEVIYPVVGIVWYLEPCHLVHESYMPYRIECLGKIEREDVHILIG